MNFNDSIALWQSYQSTKPATELHVRNGHVIDKAKSDVTARFDDDEASRDCLLKAGWTEKQPYVFVP